MEKLKKLLGLKANSNHRRMNKFPIRDFEPTDSLGSWSGDELRDYEFHNVADDMISEEDSQVAVEEERAMEQQLIENMERERLEALQVQPRDDGQRQAYSDGQADDSSKPEAQLNHVEKTVSQASVANHVDTTHPNKPTIDEIDSKNRNSITSLDKQSKAETEDLSDDDTSVAGSVVSNVTSHSPTVINNIPLIEKKDEPRYSREPAVTSFTMSSVADVQAATECPGIVEDQQSESDQDRRLELLQWLYRQSIRDQPKQLGTMSNFCSMALSGSRVRGQVQLELSEKLAVRCVELRAFGYAQIFQSSRKSYKKYGSDNGELLLLQTFQLCKDVDMVLPGSYNFPFRFRLPKELPPSLLIMAEEKLLSAAYFIEARIRRKSSSTDLVTVCHLPVTLPFDISAADYCLPAVWAFTETVKLNKAVKGVKRHPIHVEVRLPRMAFLRDEIVPVTAVFDNQSPLGLISMEGRIILKIAGRLKGKVRPLLAQYKTAPAVSERHVEPGQLRMVRFEMEPVFQGAGTENGTGRLGAPDSTHRYTSYVLSYCVQLRITTCSGQRLTVETPLLVGNYASLGLIKRSPRPPAQLTRTKVGKL